MIEVRYFYSACVGIKTRDTSLLCDPWFTDGIYDGSWYQYPKLENPLAVIPRYDFIYVSHIHPDHYDPIFLHKYLERYPETQVIIANFTPNFLANKMKSDRINFKIIDRLQIGSTRISILPNESQPLDVDSALVVQDGSHSVVNMNDNQFNEVLISKIIDLCSKPKIALVSYAGAGPYPQTYFDDHAELTTKAELKKKQFIDRYFQMSNALDPEKTIPFAGKYLLGGKLSQLNNYRGIADAIEIAKLDPDRAVVLADGGHATINTSDLKPTAVRSEAYDQVAQDRYADAISKNPMLYEKYFGGLDTDHIPFARLLPKAYRNAVGKSSCEYNYYFCIQIGDGWFVMNARRGEPFSDFRKMVDDLKPRSEIEIDRRYLFGLLTMVFHWNNAQVGSQYQTRRHPDVFNRGAEGFLNFLHI